MKQRIILVLALALSALMLQSCFGKKDQPDFSKIKSGVVTVKTNPTTKAVFLQLDEKTTLLPVNFNAHPYQGREVRAFVNYEEVQAPHEGYSKAVNVKWIDQILTKGLAPFEKEMDTKYGQDPVFLEQKDCLIEDGYLTLIFTANYTVGLRQPHEINLVKGVNPQDPFELEFRHNAHGDSYGGSMASSWVAFSLKDLPDTKGEKKTLTIKFRSYNGTVEIIKLDYITGKTTQGGKQAPDKGKQAQLTSTAFR